MRKRICLTSIVVVGLTCAAAAPMAAGRARGPSPQTFDVSVTVTGHAPDVSGSPSDYFITFSAPVAIPNATLAAGTYIFAPVVPKAIRVTSTDRKIVYTTFLTTPVGRDNSRRAEVRFRRTAGNEAPRIVAFYPEHSYDGYAPIYPSAHSSASSSSRSKSAPESSRSASSKSSAVSG